MAKNDDYVRIGIDIGGTFTDLMVVNLVRMEMHAAKVPTTPHNLLAGIEDGLKEIKQSLHLSGEEVKLLVHGTTAAINALIERKGARTALITTEKFIDVLEIGEIYRPRELLFDPFREKEAPFIPKRYRIGARERLRHDGKVLIPLEEKDLLTKLSWLDQEGIQSISICTLFSYVNPVHEIKIRDLVEAHYPHIATTVSSQISPEMGEYKRSCTTAAEGFIKPIINRYVPEFDRSMRAANISCPLCLMKGDGGLSDLQTAVDNPSTLLLSGPVGGIVAAAYMGGLVGRKSILTLDMGGTSCDTSTIKDGEALEVLERDVGGMPLTGPFVRIETIGAGGGSIAGVSEVGELLVGPESAGADPGPACYRRGGTEATVTDANLILGLLNPDSFAKFRLSTRDARTAVEQKIAGPLNMQIEEAALAIRAIINSKLAGAIRLVSVERGLDPGDFSLMAFGAAGPLEAADIADELGITEVIIPRYPGVFSAFGMLLTDFKHNYLQSVFKDLKDDPSNEIEAAYKTLAQKAQADLMRGSEIVERVFVRSLDMRYWKQSYVLNIATGNDKFDRQALISAGQSFTRKHRELYGFSEKTDKIKIINARLTAIGRLKRPIVQKRRKSSENRHAAGDARKGVRSTFVVDEQVTIYDRDGLGAGAHLTGPAIVEAQDTTIWIPPRHAAVVDLYENLLIKKIQ